MAENVPGSFPSFVVEDLRKDPRFCDLPYVTGSPYFRFYAGTPLISPEGYRIGSVFVIDDRPHPSPKRRDLEFLGVMAANVMKHLEMQKVSREQARQMRMSKALAAFVEGKSNTLTASKSDYPPSEEAGPASPSSPYSEKDVEISDNAVQNAQRSEEPEDPNTAVARAASLLREALDVRYTVFLDTNDDTATPVTKKANLVASSSRSTMDDFQEANITPAFLRYLCRQYHFGKIWSFHQDGSFEYDDQQPLNLEREDDTWMSSTENTGPDAKTRTENDVVLECFPGSRQILFVPLWDNARLDYASACFAISEREVPVFTTATDVAFVRAFINSLTVVCGRISATRGEQQKADFISSMSHVGSSPIIDDSVLTCAQELRSPLHGIVASTEMLQASKLDPNQQELCRMVDLCGQTLLETISQILDFNKVGTKHTERSCTVLIRHRSQINDFLQKSHGPKALVSRPHAPEDLDPSGLLTGLHAGSSLHVYSSRDVLTLCEEALDVVVTSFESASAISSLTEMSVSIESVGKARGQKSVPVDFVAENTDWRFLCSPGAIRRIVMNLISNSLKYTQQGWIRLELKRANTSAVLGDIKDARESTAIITVTDTGQGMSADYLGTKLFQPFSKDNTTAPGSGLGLSLVSGIVESLDGKIRVQSKVGQGTVVEIKIPLWPSPQESHEHGEWDGISTDLRAWCAHKTYSMWGPGIRGDTKLCDSLRSYLSDWFDLQEDASTKSPDLVFFVGDDRTEFLASHARTTFRTHAIMLCRGHSATEFGSSPTQGPMSVQTLTVPIGPKKLSRILQICQEAMRRRAPSMSKKVSLAPTTNGKAQLLEQAENAGRESPKGVDIEEKIGTENEVRYHASPPRQSLPIRPPPAIERTKSTYNSRQPSVLCVDDNTINLTLLKAYNKRVGCEDIVLAEDGLQAYEAVKRHGVGFDIIFMGQYHAVLRNTWLTHSVRLDNASL